jgi:3-oxoadipate enol-lactonase
MPYATVRGLRVFYKDVGKGRPLVLVPGWGADSMVFNPILPYLKAHARLIAADPRGLGRSDDVDGPLSSRELAGDILELLNHLQIPRASILGASLGALVVRRFATLHPERVDRVILCTAGEVTSPYARRIRDLLRALVRELPPEDLMTHFLTLILSPAYIDSHVEYVRDLEMILRPNARTLRAMERQSEMMDREAAEGMGPIPAPVLVLAGGQDRVVPLHHAEALHRSLPGSRLVVLEDAAHHPFLETRDRALAAVLAFLKEPQPIPVLEGLAQRFLQQDRDRSAR